MQVLLAEKGAQLQQCQAQNDLLHEKVRVLTDSFYSLEAERTRTVADLQCALASTREQLGHYLELEAHLDGAIESTARAPALPGSSGAAMGAEGGAGGDQRVGGAGSPLLRTAGVEVPTSARRRVQHGVALAQRCGQLDRERDELARQRGALERELDSTKRGAFNIWHHWV